MRQYISAYIVAAVIFGLLDALWLNNVAVHMYRSTVSILMADQFSAGPAAAFYVIYLFGIVWFAIRPALISGQWTDALLNGSVLGLVAYATFDFTSQAVFKDWTWTLSLIDVAWGIFVSGVTAAVAAWFVLKFVKT